MKPNEPIKERSMRFISTLLTLTVCLGVVAALSPAQPPQGKKGPDDFGPPGKGGPGGFGGKKGMFGGPPRPGQILPPFLQQILELTADQKKQLDAMQRDVDAKLAKILTADQKKQLNEMMGPGKFGPPGKGFPPPPPDGPGKGFDAPPSESAWISERRKE
jgi:hypothetical protein